MAATKEHVQRVELCRLEVDPQDAEALSRISEATGAPQAWHRRKALSEYIARFAATST